MMNTA